MESTEIVKLRLLNPTNGGVLGADSFQYISIIDNDFTTPTFYLTAPQNVSVTEQINYIPIVVYLGSPPASASTVNVKFKSGNASNVTDYNFITQTLHFAANSIGPDTAYIKVLDDCIPESLDSVWLVLSNPSIGCTIGNDSIFQLKITDNDAIPSVSFSSTTPSLLENFGTYNLNVSIATPNCDSTKITVNVVGGSAILGTDYNATFPTTVVFPPNSTTTQQIPIQIINDNIVEPKDSILLQITSVTNGATINIANKKIFIIDNDTLPVATVSFVNTSVADTENIGGVAIPFTITNPLNVASHLYYTISGTCTNGSDYSINGGSTSPISIASNATTGNISVNIIDDNLIETSEVIIFKLDSMTGGKVGTNRTFNLYVIDNDATGFNNLDIADGIELFPNPVENDGTIYFSNLPKTLNRIELYNLLGKKICNENIAQNKFSLTNKGFVKGIYFYKINDAYGALIKEGKLIVE